MALRLYLPGMEDMAPEVDGERRAVRKFRRVIRREDTFNRALMNIVDGRGSVLENLTRITGMSVDSLKGRIKRARYDYDDDEPATLELDADEKRYMARMYANSDDPEVQDFLARTHACTRVRPDWRGAHDADARPVGKKRRARRGAA